MTRSISVDDASLSIPYVPPFPFVDEFIRPHTDPVIRSASPPTIVPITEIHPLIVQAPENRGRSRSRSPRRLNPSHTPSSRSHTPSSCSRSRSPSRWRASNVSYISPGCPYIITPPSRSSTPCPPGPVPIIIQSCPRYVQPPPPPIMVVPPEVPSPRSSRSSSPWCVRPPSPPSVVWPAQVPKQPVDILTFHYNKNMAYAPAAKTYDEAIDIVLELWPELRDVERDQIRLLVTGSDHLVRVPRMSWSAVLCDVPRYEVVHVQVEQLPPPPKYHGKGKGKGKWGDDNDKGSRSSGLFSSIRRIFFG